MQIHVIALTEDVAISTIVFICLLAVCVYLLCVPHCTLLLCSLPVHAVAVSAHVSVLKVSASSSLSYNMSVLYCLFLL